MTDDKSLVQTSTLSEEDSWWNETADTVEGYDLFRDEALYLLVGVPLKITRLTFRPGTQRKDAPWQDDFVSAEGRVAPAPILIDQASKILARRAKITGDKLKIAQASEFFVINDGSTGFYRQSVQYLADNGLITLATDFPESGEKGESRYDLPRSEWLTGGDVEEFDVSLKLPRGLRFSEYDTPLSPTGKAITWYMA